MAHATTASPTFFSVALRMLAPGTVVPCEIWLRHGDSPPLLYRARHLEFDDDHYQKLLASGVEEVWVSFEDSASWSVYVESQLRTRVSDERLPLDTRVQILIEASRPAMKQILEDPRAAGTVERVGNLSDAISDLIKGPEAVAASIRIMEHDYYTYTHSLHVGIFSVALARSLGISDAADLGGIGRGALMHDCGKCLLPAFLLNKPGRLVGEEWKLMMTHPLRGVEILQETGWRDPFAFEVCLSHHERMDGSGYPRGLIGRDIPEAARIAAICDAYDAMTSERSYKRALRGVDALKIIRNDNRTHYDQPMVEQFIRLLINR